MKKANLSDTRAYTREMNIAIDLGCLTMMILPQARTTMKSIYQRS